MPMMSKMHTKTKVLQQFIGAERYQGPRFHPVAQAKTQYIYTDTVEEKKRARRSKASGKQGVVESGGGQ